MKDKKFLYENLIAHRGIHDKYHIENTMDAFDLAIRYKLTIELDIHLLKDNEIVVFHDDSLKRVTGFNKQIKNCTYKELKKIPNINIPTLKEVLDYVNGKVPIIIEYKFDRKVPLLEKESIKLLDNYKGKFAIQSFNPLTILWFKLNRPNYIRGLLVSNIFPDNFLLRYMLSNKISNSITKPDYIGINVNIFNKKKILKLRKKYTVIGYTIKNIEELIKYKKLCNNLICNIKKESIKEFLLYQNKETDPLRTVSQKE